MNLILKQPDHSQLQNRTLQYRRIHEVVYLCTVVVFWNTLKPNSKEELNHPFWKHLRSPLPALRTEPCEISSLFSLINRPHLKSSKALSNQWLFIFGNSNIQLIYSFCQELAAQCYLSKCLVLPSNSALRACRRAWFLSTSTWMTTRRKQRHSHTTNRANDKHWWSVYSAIGCVIIWVVTFPYHCCNCSECFVQPGAWAVTEGFRSRADPRRSTPQTAVRCSYRQPAWRRHTASTTPPPHGAALMAERTTGVSSILTTCSRTNSSPFWPVTICHLKTRFSLWPTWNEWTYKAELTDKLQA